MKQTLALLAATTALFTQVGCSNSNTPAAAPAAAAPEATGQQAAKVTYGAGSYTFIIEKDGTYQIESGNGQIWSDKLTLSERDQFAVALRPFENKGTQALSLEACTDASDADKKALCDVVTQLHTQYAPVGLPSEACVSAAKNLDNLHREAVKCSADADCAFVSYGYSVIGATSIGSVQPDSGTWFHALPVANAQFVRDNFGQLSDAKSVAAGACTFARNENAFQLNYSTGDLEAPSCVQNVCVSASL